MRYINTMNRCLSGLIIFSLLVSAAAKPGEPYVLTGREKSIFSIYQADMKAFPELYEGEDINAYYAKFKTLNNLEERKLKRGEELLFPHTTKSKEIQEAEQANAAREAQVAEASAARARAAEAAATDPEQSDEHLSLFGSDSRSRPGVSSLEVERARAEARRKHAREKAVQYFQHTLLNDWIYYHRAEFLAGGSIDTLVAIARETVDAEFSEALVLHRYPEKNIFIFEFEKPKNISDYFFVAIKMEENGGVYFYALEKGISFFGAGDESVLFEWRSGGNPSRLGGRSYKDLASFRQELEAGRPVHSDLE